MIYQVLKWLANTKAWLLVRGIIFLSVFILIAYIFQMNTILWFVKNGLGIMAIAIVVVFQPELRRALEKIGEKNVFKTLLPFDKSSDEADETSYAMIASASYKMASVKTGALIVIENKISLKEYEETGIELDSIISEELLINIFEHNTPLHDGAVIIRDNRIVAATCYLPISDNMDLSKVYGTRHRAGLGLSEVCDAYIIIVSEETGEISLAHDGNLIENLSEEDIINELKNIKTSSKEVD